MAKTSKPLPKKGSESQSGKKDVLEVLQDLLDWALGVHTPQPVPVKVPAYRGRRLR